MRITMLPQPIDVGRFNMKLRGPGNVRHVVFTHQKELVMVAGKADFREVPVIFVEVSPDQPIRDREFICIRQGDVFELADDEHAEFCATGCSGSGMVVHVFEIQQLAKNRIVDPS